MKKILATIISVGLTCSVFAFDPSMNLKPMGSVKEYTKMDYTITEKFGDYYRSPKSKYVHIYDGKGKPGAFALGRPAASV